MADHTYEVISPVTGEVLSRPRRSTLADVHRAVRAASDAVEACRQESFFTRAAWCHRIADTIESRASALAPGFALEHGKPLGQAHAELLLAATGFRLAAEEAKRLRGETLPVGDSGKLVFTTRKPRGVFAAITPFNFPVNIPVEYLGPLLACGNAVVWRPAPTTGGIATALHDCIREADLPPGLVQLLTGDDVEPAQALVAHPDVVGVCFTGSSATGRAIAQAAHGKVQLMELGGNGPIVVLEDADLDRAAPAIASSAFFNSGQSCSAAGRVIVADSIADSLQERLVDQASREVVGDPLDSSTTMGPVHTRAIGQTMTRHVHDAVARGALLAFGGDVEPGRDTDQFWRPTVLAKVAPDAQVMMEETFGPLLPICPVAGGVEAVIQVANSGQLGLSTAVFGRDLDRTIATAGRLRAGQVVVNDTSNYWELHLPFGGAPGRESGTGRLGGRYIAEFVTDIQTISVDLAEPWR